MTLLIVKACAAVQRPCLVWQFEAGCRIWLRCSVCSAPWTSLPTDIGRPGLPFDRTGSAPQLASCTSQVQQLLQEALCTVCVPAYLLTPECGLLLLDQRAPRSVHLALHARVDVQSRSVIGGCCCVFEILSTCSCSCPINLSSATGGQTSTANVGGWLASRHEACTARTAVRAPPCSSINPAVYARLASVRYWC